MEEKEMPSLVLSKQMSTKENVVTYKKITKKLEEILNELEEASVEHFNIDFKSLMTITVDRLSYINTSKPSIATSNTFAFMVDPQEQPLLIWIFVGTAFMLFGVFITLFLLNAPTLKINNINI